MYIVISPLVERDAPRRRGEEANHGRWTCRARPSTCPCFSFDSMIHAFLCFIAHTLRPLRAASGHTAQHSTVHTSHTTMPVEDLNDKVVLTSPSSPNTTATILKYGATVISWKVNNAEQLWLSEGAKLDATKPVRGGIPLVFPVFGKSEEAGFNSLPQHGFARNSTWEFLGQTKANPPTVQFALSPEQANPDIYSKWDNGDNDFTLFLTITLNDDNLTTNIEVTNSDSKPWKFNWLFHTYLRVAEIEDTLVNNLPGEECYDQMIGESYTEAHPAIDFSEELDRIYKNVSTEKILQVIELGKVVHNVKRVNLPDVVVWNPWIEKSKGMGDFEPKSGFHNMVCIEPGHVHDFVELKPGESWNGEQIIYKGDAIKLQSI
jgi:glucose-6-phosphate 1-epimerase